MWTTEKPEVCDSCGYPAKKLTPTVLESWKNPRCGQKVPMCDLCRKTKTGLCDDYNDQCTADTRELLRTICHVGNAILAAIRSEDTTS